MLQKSVIIRDSDPSITELDFSLNAFRQQKVLTDDEAYARMISRLLLMRKGTYPTEPGMGINLGAYRFRDMDSILAGELKEVIMAQISAYIPGITIEDVTVSKQKYRNDFILYIDIAFTGTGKHTSASFAYLQHGTLIVSSEITIKKQKKINVNNEED